MYREILGYPDYEVDEYGSVRNKRTLKILKARLSKSGYLRINLKKKTVYVHRLVANAFLANPYGYTQINHKDEDKRNNYYGNLEWCDVAYNNAYGTRQERCDHARGKSVVASSGDVDIKEYPSIKDAAADLNIDPSNIRKVLIGERKSCKGYTWRYKTGLTNKMSLMGA